MLWEPRQGAQAQRGGWVRSEPVGNESRITCTLAELQIGILFIVFARKPQQQQRLCAGLVAIVETSQPGPKRHQRSLYGM